MKIIHRIIKNDEQEAYIELMKNFDYELLERFIEDKTTDLHLIRFDKKFYSRKLAKLEREYFSYEKIRLFPYVLISGFSFISVTAFLILFLTLKDNFDYTFWFLVLLLPVFILILLGVSLFMYKYFKIVRNPIKNKKRQQDILLEAQSLKNKE